MYYVDTDYTTSKGFVYQFNFWILGVVVKLMPCLILTIITCWLIITLCRYMFIIITVIIDDDDNR